jgi:hypothetical protein
MTGLANLMMKRIRAAGRGKRAFAAKDFLDLGSRAGIDQALSRLVRAGLVRRMARGFYDWPRHSPILDAPAPPDPAAAIAALSRRIGQPIVRDQLAAAYAMGLTTAVPTRFAYVSARKAADLVIAGRKIAIAKAPAALRAWLGSPAAPIVQALLWARDAHLELDAAAATIARHAPDAAKHALARDLSRLPDWAALPARKIVSNRANMAA